MNIKRFTAEDEELRLKLLQVRTKLGLSQTEVGKEIGITHASLSSIESGKTRPRSSTRIRIDEFLQKHQHLLPETIVNHELAEKWSLIAQELRAVANALESSAFDEDLKNRRLKQLVKFYKAHLENEGIKID